MPRKRDGFIPLGDITEAVELPGDRAVHEPADLSFPRPAKIVVVDHLPDDGYGHQGLRASQARTSTRRAGVRIGSGDTAIIGYAECAP